MVLLVLGCLLVTGLLSFMLPFLIGLFKYNKSASLWIILNHLNHHKSFLNQQHLVYLFTYLLFITCYCCYSNCIFMPVFALATVLRKVQYKFLIIIMILFFSEPSVPLGCIFKYFKVLLILISDSDLIISARIVWFLLFFSQDKWYFLHIPVIVTTRFTINHIYVSRCTNAHVQTFVLPFGCNTHFSKFSSSNWAGRISLTCCSVRLSYSHPLSPPYPRNLLTTILLPYSPKLFCFLFSMSNRICLLLGRSKTVTIGTLADMPGRWGTCLVRLGAKDWEHERETKTSRKKDEERTI